ncbi:hypothetical protein [Pseudoalteromonas piscicida]|uniref:Uncharacterized protein n=1 Tax=Pseudoalteromonas piscicida TaxID=43662 RepID=A0A2A5JV49_PSEO7|nr:hypothetical protein [Pseudoalteromonas piscicida]PCK33199.1 hypothetical protein CEX98_03105 [Pseudoalteromonas piscicida]
MSIKNILTLQKELGNLVSVCADKEDQDAFSVGYIVELSDSLVLIDSYDGEGCRDGGKLRKVDDVIVVETNGQYEQKIASLIDSSNDENKNSTVYKPNIRSLIDAVNDLKSEFVKVDIYFGLPEFKYSGKILDVKDGVIHLEKVDEENEDDGEAFLILDLVQGIDYFHFK